MAGLCSRVKFLLRAHVCHRITPFAVAFVAENGTALNGIGGSRHERFQNYAACGWKCAESHRRSVAHGATKFEGFVAFGWFDFYAQFGARHVADAQNDR